MGMEENDDGASNTSLPTLATSANLIANTTNFIVEAKEKLFAHNQHMSRILPNKTASKTELSVTPTMSKHSRNKQGNDSMGGRKDPSQYGAMVSPVVRRQDTKTAWRSPKAESYRWSSSPRSNPNASPPRSLRNQTDVPVYSKSSPDVKRLSNRTPRSSMSQISLSYQESAREKFSMQQSQRKQKSGGFSSSPLPRKEKNETQSPPSSKGISI